MSLIGNHSLKSRHIILLTVFVSVLLFTSSCTVVKPYQMAYLNDEEMALSPRKLQQFDTNFQTYREGASGGEGGKVGGGCGCN